MKTPPVRIGIQEIIAAILCASITKHYRQTTYGDQYTITFEEESDGTWTAWCSLHPQNPYSDSVEKCHLYASGKICVRAGHEPRTLDRCKGACADNDVDTMQRTFLVSDVAMGVGIACLAAATILYLTR